MNASLVHRHELQVLLLVGYDHIHAVHAAQAAVGNVPFTDGAPISAADFDETFPYLRTPIPGATN